WPRALQVTALAYNTALVQNPPKTWDELIAPDAGYRLGLTLAGAGGTSWGTTLFQKIELGEDYWERMAAVSPQLFESGGPLASALTRGEISVASALTHGVYPLMAAGAPIELVYPAEGVPATPSAAGVSATAPNPNA